MTPEQLKKRFPEASASFLKRNANTSPSKAAQIITTPEPTRQRPIDNATKISLLKQVLTNGRKLAEEPINTWNPEKSLFIVVPGIIPMGAARYRTKGFLKYMQWKKQFGLIFSQAVDGEIPQVPIRSDMAFYFPMPPSWTVKEHDNMNGKPHRQSPDGDNCLKAVLDAIFAQDAAVSDSFIMKRWCRPGDERIEIIFYYEQ